MLSHNSLIAVLLIASQCSAQVTTRRRRSSASRVIAGVVVGVVVLLLLCVLLACLARRRRRMAPGAGLGGPMGNTGGPGWAGFGGKLGGGPNQQGAPMNAPQNQTAAAHHYGQGAGLQQPQYGPPSQPPPPQQEQYPQGAGGYPARQDTQPPPYGKEGAAPYGQNDGYANANGPQAPAAAHTAHNDGQFVGGFRNGNPV